MQVVVLANSQLKEELLCKGVSSELEIVWIEKLADAKNYPGADAVIDLLFEKNADRMELLNQLPAKLVIINSVEYTLSETCREFVRINAWETFLQSSLIEGTCYDETLKTKAEQLFSLFNKKLEWVKDEPGFISARVISMIINEAFLALEERVSTEAEMNIAMRLGTNYPYGPFEWAEKIGVHKIYSLLYKLSLKNSRFKPASMLERAEESC